MIFGNGIRIMVKEYKRHKYAGVRPAKSGKPNLFEVSFPKYKGSKDKAYRNVEAKNEKEAYDKRVRLIEEYRMGQLGVGESVNLLNTGLSVAWEQLINNVSSDLDVKYPPKTRIKHTEITIKKTKSKFKKVFNRLFSDFRLKHFPAVDSPSQLTLPFFERYKNYYCSELGRASGWRAELIMVKTIMKRLFRLGYVRQDIIKALEEMKRPSPIKKQFPDIPKNKFNEWLSFIKKDNLYNYRIIHFLKRTGRRIEETTLIERKDLDWNGIKIEKIDIVAETTKQKKKLPLDILDEDLSILLREAYRDSKKHKAPNLFLNEQGNKVSQKTLCKYLKKTSKQICGVELTNHYFRHRFFTECGKRNLHMPAVMAIAGLTDPDVLVKYYSHSDKEGQLKILEMSKNL